MDEQTNPPPGEMPPIPESNPPRLARPVSVPPSPPPPMSAGPGPAWWPNWTPPRKPRTWIAILLGGLLLMSVLANMALLAALAVQTVAGEKYRTQVLREGSANEIVAVVPVSAIIDENAATWVSQVLDHLADDKSVKAVIIHVDSPGGTVGASDKIHHAISGFRRDTGKQVIVSQGAMATSGGYYVSVAGDYIVAEPTTWTGNIGVIMTTFMARKGLEEKLGVTPVVIKSSKTPFKDVPSLFREMTPPEQKYVEGLVDSAYQRFVKVVREGRPNIEADRVGELADGRVFTADEALANGLIDKIGYAEDAYDVAASRSGHPSAKVVLYKPRTPSLAELLLSGSSNLDPAQQASAVIEGMIAPRLLYLYHGQSPGVLSPNSRYPLH